MYQVGDYVSLPTSIVLDTVSSTAGVWVHTGRTVSLFGNTLGQVVSLGTIMNYAILEVPHLGQPIHVIVYDQNKLQPALSPAIGSTRHVDTIDILE